MPSNKYSCFIICLVYSSGVEYSKPLCKTDYKSLLKNDEVTIREIGSLMSKTTCMECVNSRVPDCKIDQNSLRDSLDTRKDPFCR